MGLGARDVLDVLSMFANVGVLVRVEGGWGVDALLGVQHREHGDLDLVLDAEHLERAQVVLERGGFELQFSDPPGLWSYRDVRGRDLDLTVVAADRYGDRWVLNRPVGRGEPDYPFDCFTYGWIAGEQVHCLGPQTQIAHHLGYETEDVDRWDVALLQERFALPVPEALRSLR